MSVNHMLPAGDEMETCFFKTQNGKVDVGTGRSLQLIFSRTAELDTSAGQKLVSARKIPRSWLPNVHPISAPPLVSAKKQRPYVLVSISLIVTVGQLNVRVTFLFVANLSNDVILGTSFTDHHVKSILPRHRKVMFYNSPSVCIVGSTQAQRRNIGTNFSGRDLKPFSPIIQASRKAEIVRKRLKRSALRNASSFRP